MKNSWILTVLIVSICSIAFADEHAVLNDPKNAWENFKGVVSVLQPSADVIYDVIDSDFSYGTSVRLLTLEENEYLKWIDIRAGWAETKLGYGTVSLALDRLTGKELLKYAHIGWFGGKDFESGDWITGPVLGTKVEF